MDEASAGLNPAQYVIGLAKAAQRAGRHVVRPHPGRRREARGSQRQPAFSSFHFARLVAGTGSAPCQRRVHHFGHTRALRKKVIPIGSYIIATEVLPANLARELSPRNRMIYDSKHFLYYYRLTPDNRMLFGGRAAFFPESENTVRKSAELLRQGMIKVYPQLQQTKVEFVWGGTLDFAFDVMPHSGKIEGMHFAVGFAGHGVAAATWMGAKLAGVICGDAGRQSIFQDFFSAGAHRSTQREYLGVASGGNVLPRFGLLHVIDCRQKCGSS